MKGIYISRMTAPYPQQRVILVEGVRGDRVKYVEGVRFGTKYLFPDNGVRSTMSKPEKFNILNPRGMINR